MIDHETFRNAEIDSLYGELDEEASAAMTAHAATCADCAARFERLKKTRGLVLAAAVEAVPDDFESRIMAAVDAGLAKRSAVDPIGRAAGAAGVAGAAAGANAAAAPPKAEGGAKVLRLLSRPSFAVAATFVLVIGAGALILARSGTSLKSMAANDEGPSMAAATAAPGLTPVPMPAASGAVALGEAQTIATATAAPTTMAVAPPAAVALQAGSAVAMNDEAIGGLRASAPAAKPSPSPRKGAAAKTKSSADDRAFASARSLYDAGRYADALPRFEALSGSDPEADLYAARCIAKTRGCAAAEARYDAAARTNAGTESGSRAQLEGARCYQSTGDVVAARKRYQAAKDEGVLEKEASKALDDLDHTGAGAGAGAAGGAHAAPKAAAPREMAPDPAPAPASPPAKR